MKSFSRDDFTSNFYKFLCNFIICIYCAQTNSNPLSHSNLGRTCPPICQVVNVCVCVCVCVYACLRVCPTLLLSFSILILLSMCCREVSIAKCQFRSKHGPLRPTIAPHANTDYPLSQGENEKEGRSKRRQTAE